MMITIELQGEDYEFNPAAIDEFLERNDYIRSLRITFKTFQSELPVVESANLVAFTEVFLSRTNLAVTMDEEIAFSSGSHGFFYDLWRTLRHKSPKFKKLRDSPNAGVNAASKLWNTLDNDEKTLVRLAVDGIDQKKLQGNSDGPTVESDEKSGQQPEPVELVVADLPQQKSPRADSLTSE